MVSRDGVFEANHGSYAITSVAFVLPDSMTFSMAVPPLLVGLLCFHAVLMCVTDLVDVSLNALPCLMAICVIVAPLEVALSGL